MLLSWVFWLLFIHRFFAPTNCEKPSFTDDKRELQNDENTAPKKRFFWFIWNNHCRRSEIPNEPVNGEKRDIKKNSTFGYNKNARTLLVDRLTRDYAANRQPADSSQFDISDYQKVSEVMSMEGYHLNHVKYHTDGDPTFQAYLDFMKLYDTSSSTTDSKRDGFDKFLDAVLEMTELSILWAFVNEINGNSVLWNKQKFKDELRRIWFPKSFEQIFVGIEYDDEGKAGGTKHLLRLAAQNKKTGKNSDDDEIKITGAVDVVEGLVQDVTYESQGITGTNTMFVGTTPELELALYTLLFLQFQTDQSAQSAPWSGSKEYNLKLYNGETKDFSKITVKVAARLDKSGWLLTAAHPVRPSAAVVARDY